MKDVAKIAGGILLAISVIHAVRLLSVDIMPKVRTDDDSNHRLQRMD